MHLCPNIDGEGVFMVQSFNDKFIVCAGTEKGKHQWVSSISSTIEKLFKVFYKKCFIVIIYKYI